MVENDIKIIKQKIEGKNVKEVTQTPQGITITFTDNSKFSINSYAYQMLLE